MLGTPRIRTAIAAAVACLLLGWAGGARAESSLRLPNPGVFGTIPASTYDESHQRVGSAHLVMESLDDNRVRLLVESGIDGGARTVATAEFESVDNDRFLKLLREESRSFDPDGLPLGVLAIDHESGVARCGKPDGKAETIDLPSDDRVANVPLSLLVQPLLDGSADEVSFQLLLCRFGGRLIDVDARVADVDREDSIVEVEYQPDFGSFVSLVASRWIPKLSMWFDGRSRHPWIGHRLPLYSKGPEVFVIRDGVPSGWLSRLR